MLKAYKYRLYPNEDQKVQLTKTFGSCRFVYNYYLEKKIKLYETEQKSISRIDCNNHCNQQLKNEFVWLKDIDKFALTNAIYNLDSAYQKFFKQYAGFPKFKCKHNHNYSYTSNFTNNNIEVNFSGEIKLPKLKWVKCKTHREFAGKIKSATISCVASGKYYVSVLTEQLEAAFLPRNDKVYAFDLGLIEFLIDTNGNHIKRPRALYEYEERLKKLQRQLCGMTKFSNNYKKQAMRIAKLHEKISNIRNDFSNKLSTQIINDNQVIISEDLQISNMIKNHNLAKSIADVGWSDFMRKLEYKAKWYGRTYHKINTWYASSQTCSDCGVINKKIKLSSVREWICEECASTHQRDENAAKNILSQGIKENDYTVYSVPYCKPHICLV